MSGNGVAGILTALLRIITKISLPENHTGEEISAFIYFGIAALVNIICIFGFLALNKLAFAQYYLRSRNKGNINGHEPSETDTLVPREPLKQASVWTVFKKIFPDALSVFFVFFVTLALYPGVTSLIVPVHNPGWLGDWYQIILIVSFFLLDSMLIRQIS